MNRDNLENGMLLGREDQPEQLCTCAWCGGPIYAGDDYYDLDGESVCEEGIESAKRKAEAV